MFDFLNETNHKLDKSAVRKTVLEASKLHKRGEIDTESLNTIVASALAWEISVGLLSKCSKRQEELDAKMKRTP